MWPLIFLNKRALMSMLTIGRRLLSDLKSPQKLQSLFSPPFPFKKTRGQDIATNKTRSTKRLFESEVPTLVSLAKKGAAAFRRCLANTSRPQLLQSYDSL